MKTHTKHNIKRALFAIAACLGLIACGKPFEATTQTYPIKAAFQATEDENTNFVMNYQREDLDTITRPESAPKAKELESDLAKRIQKTKIMTVGDDSTLKVVITIMNNNKPEEITFLSDTTIVAQKLENIKSSDGKFALQIRCEDEDCSRAWLLLQNNSSKQYAEIRYLRKTEYLKKADAAQLKATGPQAALVNDALTYAFPIERHSSTTTSGRAADVLVITRPEADNNDEDFTSGELADEEPVLQAPPASTPPETFEFEATPQLPEKPKAEVEKKETHPFKKPVVKTDEKQTPKMTVPVSENEFTLTSNPYEAYNISIPEQIFKGPYKPIRNPMLVPSHFPITPISQQEAIEPAFRIKVLAEEFIKQKVRIYEHACNYYVRQVMTLAGYTDGTYYNANSFHRVFDTKSQGLNQWRRDKFSSKGDVTSLQIQQSMLGNVANDIPENYATIIQINRSQLGKVGHVAILTKENGKLVLYDSSLRAYGPKKTVVEAKRLLNRGRPKVTLFSMPQLIQAPINGVGI